MDHKERVQQKHAIYTATGYECTDIVSGDDKSSFFSVKDGMYRLHEYSHNDAVVYVSSKDKYDSATGIAAVEVPAETQMEQEEPKPVAKRQSKKKGA